MSDNRFLFIEEAFTGAVKRLLTGRVNEMLGELPFAIPLIEFGDYGGGDVMVPTIALISCERTEKERIIQLDAYSFTVSFNLPETPESEMYCIAYATFVNYALHENPTLGGIVDRVVIIGKKYVPPKKSGCGLEWEVILHLRITVESQITGNK